MRVPAMFIHRNEEREREGRRNVKFDNVKYEKSSVGRKHFFYTRKIVKSRELNEKEDHEIALEDL